MKLRVLVVAVVSTAGCVSVSEEQREAREYRDAEWRAEFLEYRQKCHRDGGRLVVHGNTQMYRREGIPKYGDYYVCRSSLAFR